MICKKCGAENAEGKFCEECGAPLTEETDKALPENEETDWALPENKETDRALSENEETDGETDAAEPKSAEVKEALDKLEKYEEGTITHPDERPRAKRSFWCPKNPMLWSFMWLLIFGAALGGLAALFFTVDINGTQIIFGIAFSVFAIAVLFLDFGYYLPAALNLSRLFRGKGVRLEYKLKEHELVEQAEKAKKRNRGFYLAIGLFGLAFTIYYIYILATAVVQLTIMWISLIFSICVFVICALLFFLMPKYNYLRMMQGGKRVIIGEKSVYYGGSYYHWRNVQPEATFGNVNSKKHELQLTFVQEFKNGNSRRRKIELYVPDRELKSATTLVSTLEASAKAYQERQLKNSVLSESPDKDDKKRKK